MGDKLEKRKEDIVIRAYRNEDHPQVIRVFKLGMRSLVRDGFIKTVCSTQFLSVLVVCLSVTIWLFQSFLYSTPTVLTMLLGAAYGVTVASIEQYIQQACESDLSNIQGVYFNTGGCFLVAIDTSNNNQVVGTIAGEGKGENEFEMRRMFVDPAIHGRGLGKRLVQALEKELKGRKMALATSTVQYAAHALYKRQGYQVTKRIPLQIGMFKYLPGFELVFYEKNF